MAINWQLSRTEGPRAFAVTGGKLSPGDTQEKFHIQACYCDLQAQAAFLESISKSIISVIIMKIFDENTVSRWVINLSRKTKKQWYFHQVFGCQEKRSSTLSEYR